MLERWAEFRNPREAATNGNGGGNALEELRRKKVQLAQLDLNQRQGATVNRRWMQDRLVEFATCIRNAGDTLQRKFGTEALAIVESGVKEFERRLDTIDDADLR